MLGDSLVHELFYYLSLFNLFLCVVCFSHYYKPTWKNTYKHIVFNKTIGIVFSAPL